jgi:thymidylate synthase (FAD)
MKVTLINCTPLAVETLLFTKQTRLNMTANAFEDICRKVQEDPEWAHQELAYMADTIPSSWEFVDYTFMVEGVSRAYTHQQVRTRAASYAQQTLRVLDVSGGFEYVFTDRNKQDVFATGIIVDVCNHVRAAYAKLIEIGQPPEDARGILPTNIATNIVCKFNLRTMADLAASRTGGRTQGEYQRVINAMIDEVLKVHPWADKFLFQQRRDYFEELEQAIKAEWPDDLLKRGKFLKLVDKMRKERK